MRQITVEKTSSRGIAAAPAYLYQEPDLSAATYCITEEQTENEVQLFEKAKQKVSDELKLLAEKNQIFAAHLEIAEDFTFSDGVLSRIRNEQKNVQIALQDTVEELALIFDSMDDPYMKERAADIRDIGKRFMAQLKGVQRPDLAQISREVIVVAKDLFPSDTVKMNPTYIKGIITEEGGITSHVSIIARSMGIPALVGVGKLLDILQNGIEICMDAEAGMICIEPDHDTIREFLQKQEDFEKRQSYLKKLRSQPAVTRDGKRISLCANIGNLEDIERALPMNIDGIGLFRSEFLYMENDHFPSEEEQFQVYKAAAELCPKELTIRTLDIGGDKELSYFDFDKEENPFLGWRAIRISLDMEDMFKTQLRAILRASAFGHVRIMFPMIISLEELRAAGKLTTRCMEELEQEGLEFDRNIEIGMMIETPASVMLAEEFAKEVDFFSIGTNDLTQYLLAVDRGNRKVADRYSYFHPAVVKAIAKVIAAGHKENIKVGMCGEMAGDPDAVLLLLDLGLDEFSMSAGNADYIREKILNL